MISEIISKDKCTGCELCANVCNHNAIKMVSDDMGFYYPNINEACIECNLCKIKCDERLIKTNNYLEPETYAAWSKDKDIRYNSTSGGLFSELANEIIRMGGCVVGAQYNEDNLVEHVLVENLIGIEKIRQSKYIQSRSGNIYQIVKKMLNENRYVAFCGTPCQVAALNSYLGHKSFEKLITIDFICRGVNSPKAFKAWLNEIENSNNSKVVKVWFKYKEGGWKTSPKRTRLDFKNGNFKIKDGWAIYKNYKIELQDQATGLEKVVMTDKTDIDWLYYTTNQLIKAKPDGTSQIILDEEDSFWYQIDKIDGKWIYYQKGKDKYKIDEDGNNKSLLEKG